MIKRSTILLIAVVAIYESDYPEAHYYSTGGAISPNTGNNLVVFQGNNTIISNPNSYLSYGLNTISAPRGAFEMYIFTNTLNRLTNNVQINMLSNWTLKRAYNKLDDYVYDYASLQIAQNVINSAIYQKQYKYNNLAAQIQKDNHAGWYNFVAGIRNSVNKSIIKSYTVDIQNLYQLQNTVIQVYNDNQKNLY